MCFILPSSTAAGKCRFREIALAPLWHECGAIGESRPDPYRLTPGSVHICQLSDLLDQLNEYDHKEIDEQGCHGESHDRKDNLRDHPVAGIGPDKRQSERSQSGQSECDRVLGMVPSPLWPVARANPFAAEWAKQKVLAEFATAEVAPPHRVIAERCLPVVSVCAIHGTSPCASLPVRPPIMEHTLSAEYSSRTG